MRSHDVRYLVGEGLRNTWQNRFMALASIGVLISCLFLTGFSYLAFVNIDHLFQTVYEQNVVAVYLDADADDAVVQQVKDGLQTMPNIASVAFISKEEMLERYKNDLPPETYESLQGEDNPLQDAYIVSLADLEQFDTTLRSVKELDGVESVSYDGDLAATLTRVRRMVLGIGGAIIIVLLAVSLFIIANTIKLTVYNRRLEIYIMKSVGATDGFIRFPFVIEGIILGLTAGGIGYGLMYLLYSRLAQNFHFGVLLSLLPFSAVWDVLLAGFLVGGTMVGMCGSIISTTRYLKREGGMRS